jgi:hypothetical protein
VTCRSARFASALLQPNAERPHAAAVPTRPLEGEPGDKQHPPERPVPTAGRRPQPVTTTAILAVIGVVTVILTAAARIPAALAEFLRACVIAAAAARELRTALTGRPPVKTPDPRRNAELPCEQDSRHPCRRLRKLTLGTRR